MIRFVVVDGDTQFLATRSVATPIEAVQEAAIMHRNRAVFTLALARNTMALLVILGGQGSLRGSTSPARSIVGSWLVVPMAPNRPLGLHAFAFTSD
jgi:hypothetical protein